MPVEEQVPQGPSTPQTQTHTLHTVARQTPYIHNYPTPAYSTGLLPPEISERFPLPALNRSQAAEPNYSANRSVQLQPGAASLPLPQLNMWSPTTVLPPAPSPVPSLMEIQSAPRYHATNIPSYTPPVIAPVQQSSPVPAFGGFMQTHQVKNVQFLLVTRTVRSWWKIG